MRLLKSLGNGKPGGGVLGALRHLLISRRPRVRIRLRPREETPLPLASTSHPSTNLAVPSPFHDNSPTAGAVKNYSAQTVAPAVPAPPRDPEADDSDDESALEEDGSGDHHEHGNDDRSDEEDHHKEKLEKKNRKKKKTKRGPTNSAWVAKLLNQAAPHKDRVHTRKKRKPRGGDAAASKSTSCHPLLCIASDPHAALLARVFDFLPRLEPGRHCALVNRAIAVSVDRYYARYCDWPRPRALLAHKIFSLRHAETTGLLTTVLGMLPLTDRVRASATSHSFRRAADSLPLVFAQSRHASEFLGRLKASRVETRFQQTTVLRCEGVSPCDAVRLLRFMSDDDGDHFLSVQHVALQRIDGFEAEHHFVALVQSLFSDRISRSLRSLVLADLSLTDPHFRRLARLFYDGHFPRLETLDISRNLFSSRFMRDWARSFREDRYKSLVCLNVTGVGMGVDDMERFFECLRHVPVLRELCISHNFCSVGNMHVLAEVLAQRCLVGLEVLSCSAVSASDHGLHILIEALRMPGVCAALRSLDLSGNDLSAGDQSMRSLADAFSSASWPSLYFLNLSFTKPSTRGVQLLTRGLTKHARPSLREIHLAGNDFESDAFESLMVAMAAGALHRVELLNLSDNKLGALEFELLAHSLNCDSCPRLHTLLLSANNARADGITRFRRFFNSCVARSLHTLDLSDNAIPSHSLAWIAEELLKSRCYQLQVLNVSRNMAPHSVVRFQQLIRSHQCPSLACVQVGYAQSQEQGYAFVQNTRAKMSVDELRRLKQLRFDARMECIRQENVAKAERAAARCKRQTKLLRELYDHMESQADRALRRRKRVRKSPHLHFHEEIQRLCQAKYHEKIRRNLERALQTVKT